jgi:hypothetical protein
MEIVIGFILGACIIATLVAVFTGLALWIGIGLLAFCFLSIWQVKRMHDPSGDGGIAMFFGVVAPSFILAAAFLIATGIKYLAVRSL